MLFVFSTQLNNSEAHIDSKGEESETKNEITECMNIINEKLSSSILPIFK